MVENNNWVDEGLAKIGFESHPAPTQTSQNIENLYVIGLQELSTEIFSKRKVTR